MEEQILEMLNYHLHPMAGHDWLIGLDKNDCAFSAKEITSHVMEFIDWFYDNRHHEGYIKVDDEPRRYGSFINDQKTIEELYRYWLNLKK